MASVPGDSKSLVQMSIGPRRAEFITCQPRLSNCRSKVTAECPKPLIIENSNPSSKTPRVKVTEQIERYSKPSEGSAVSANPRVGV